MLTSPVSTLRSDLVLPDLLDQDAYIKLLPAQQLDVIPRENLRLWCVLNGRYGLPTVELVQWLQKGIAGRKAIEIGAGSGDLCRHLGIQGTDSFCQDREDVRAFYAAMAQPCIKYGKNVQKLEALEAIELHKPEIVIGSWVTQWIDPNKPIPAGGGSMYGVKEDQILDAGVTYIVIGNEAVHNNKTILARPHMTLHLPFLRSRAAFPTLDCVFIWPNTATEIDYGIDNGEAVQSDKDLDQTVSS